MDTEYDPKKLLKAFKKEFACNGTIVDDDELGQIIQLQGDQRQKISMFLYVPRPERRGAHATHTHAASRRVSPSRTSRCTVSERACLTEHDDTAGCRSSGSPRIRVHSYTVVHATARCACSRAPVSRGESGVSLSTTIATNVGGACRGAVDVARPMSMCRQLPCPELFILCPFRNTLDSCRAVAMP